MAAVRSATLVVVVAVVALPLRGVEDPDWVCEWLGCAGFLDCFDLTLAKPKSEMRFPEAEGGNLREAVAGDASRETPDGLEVTPAAGRGS